MLHKLPYLLFLLLNLRIFAEPIAEPVGNVVDFSDLEPASVEQAAQFPEPVEEWDEENVAEVIQVEQDSSTTRKKLQALQSYFRLQPHFSPEEELYFFKGSSHKNLRKMSPLLYNEAPELRGYGKRINAWGVFCIILSVSTTMFLEVATGFPGELSVWPITLSSMALVSPRVNALQRNMHAEYADTYMVQDSILHEEFLKLGKGEYYIPFTRSNPEEQKLENLLAWKHNRAILLPGSDSWEVLGKQDLKLEVIPKDRLRELGVEFEGYQGSFRRSRAVKRVSGVLALSGIAWAIWGKTNGDLVAGSTMALGFGIVYPIAKYRMKRVQKEFYADYNRALRRELQVSGPEIGYPHSF